MKKVILFIFLVSYLQSRSQADSIPPRPPMLDEVVAFVKGYPYQTLIEKNFFFNDFDLALSDTSYQLVRYVASWDDTSGNIHVRPVKGSRLIADLPGYLLTELGMMIAFEQIIISRDKKYYRVRPFVITPTDSVTAENARGDLALCDAWLAGYKGQSSLGYTIFSKDTMLELTDTSYLLKDFDLVMQDEQEHEIVKTHITGNRIMVEKDEVTRLLKRLRPGDTVEIVNIRAEKNSKIYKVHPLTIYIK